LSEIREVPLKLKELFKYYSESINKKMKAFQAVELAAYLHSEFQHIHPFIDGNSRTARAIFIHALLAKGFPLTTFAERLAHALYNPRKRAGNNFSNNQMVQPQEIRKKIQIQEKVNYLFLKYKNRVAKTMNPAMPK